MSNDYKVVCEANGVRKWCEHDVIQIFITDVSELLLHIYPFGTSANI